jgi:PAS domain-containing protein
MGALGANSLIIAALAILWLGIAAALAIAAARRLRLAQGVLEAARANARLLAISPARPVLVHHDGRVEMDGHLARELGLAVPPKTIADLHGKEAGLDADDLASLSTQMEAARASASRIAAKVRLVGSPRVFEIRGGAAPAPEPAGTLLLWFFDTSAGEEERAKLSLRLRQTEAALNSLTYLIEAAPFPMWYRGPDLKLGLVNSAFVQAVEGKDASDVIERGAELIDAQGENSATATAREAQENGRIVSRMQPAIIHGERRMLRIVNVPLSTGAVAGFAVDVQDLEDARAELARHIESQRELADRMTAGTAQFDADRTLGFFNRPFAAMSQLDPDWLAERPEFDRVIERMRDNQRLPEVRDFPAWKEERRAWFTSPDEVIEEEWMLANGDHLRVVAQPLPDGGLRLFLEEGNLTADDLLSLMIFGIHTKAPSLSDMYDLNVAAWLGSSSVYPVRYEDLVRHVRDLESDEAEPYFTKLLDACGISPLPADWRERVRVGSDRRRSGTARENLTGIGIELPETLPERHRRLVDYAAPGLRKLLGYEYAET